MYISDNVVTLVVARRDFRSDILEQTKQTDYELIVYLRVAELLRRVSINSCCQVTAMSRVSQSYSQQGTHLFGFLPNNVAALKMPAVMGGQSSQLEQGLAPAM